MVGNKDYGRGIYDGSTESDPELVPDTVSIDEVPEIKQLTAEQKWDAYIEQYENENPLETPISLDEAEEL